MNLNSKQSKPFHGCFSRFAGDTSKLTNFHSPEWSLVRNRKGKWNKNFLKSNAGYDNWCRIPSQQVNCVVTPKDNQQTYSYQKNKFQKRMNKPSPNMHLVKGNGQEKPENAINKISCIKLKIRKC
jgi:hypothetical protein